MRNLAAIGAHLETLDRADSGVLPSSRNRTGISGLDVDSVRAHAATEPVKLDADHLTREGCRLVAEEVVRLLEDRGCLPRVELA